MSHICLEDIPEMNDLAYLASSSVTKKKSFITLTPGGGGDVVKLFLSLAVIPTKLDRLSSAGLFKSSLISVRKACQRQST